MSFPGKKLTLALLFSTCFFAAQSQYNIRAMRPTFGTEEKVVEGTPYLDDKFAESKILSNHNKQSALMRYNIFDDNMELQQEGGTFYLDPDMRINKVIVGDTEFVVGRFEYKGKPHKGFLELLDSGKVSLFAKKIVEHKEAEQAAPMKYNLAPERYIRDKDVYYYRIGTGEIARVDKIKDLLDALPEKKEEAKAFVKTEKISKEREDLIRLCNYYNAL
jgi:hypothetical protein